MLLDWNLLSRDYLDNIRSTDRFWDDWPTTDAKTLHNVVEVPNPAPVNGVAAPEFVGTTYVRGNNVKVKFKWKNDIGYALEGNVLVLRQNLILGWGTC